MFDKLDDLLLRYEDIMNELNEPNVVSDQERFRKLMKEQSFNRCWLTVSCNIPYLSIFKADYLICHRCNCHIMSNYNNCHPFLSACILK